MSFPTPIHVHHSINQSINPSIHLPAYPPLSPKAKPHLSALSAVFSAKKRPWFRKRFWRTEIWGPQPSQAMWDVENFKKTLVNNRINYQPQTGDRRTSEASKVVHYKSAADRLSVKKGYTLQTLLIWEMLTGNPKKNLSTCAAETTYREVSFSPVFQVSFWMEFDQYCWWTKSQPTTWHA